MGRIFRESMREREKKREREKERGDETGNHQLYSRHIMVPLDIHVEVERSG